jgi:hypothetical protein
MRPGMGGTSSQEVLVCTWRTKVLITACWLTFQPRRLVEFLEHAPSPVERVASSCRSW